MELEHEFILLKKSKINLEKPNSIKVSRDDREVNSDIVRLHDAFVHYIHDTLQWINSLNPDTNEADINISLYGGTMIDDKTVFTTKAMFESLYKLFSNAPEGIELNGGYTYIKGEVQNGKYEKVLLDKAELLTKLNELIKLCTLVEESHGELCIFHFGV